MATPAQLPLVEIKDIEELGFVYDPKTDSWRQPFSMRQIHLKEYYDGTGRYTGCWYHVDITYLCETKEQLIEALHQPVYYDFTEQEET